MTTLIIALWLLGAATGWVVAVRDADPDTTDLADVYFACIIIGLMALFAWPVLLFGRALLKVVNR